jgi:predicted RecA/RadA family phage recombinase
MKNYIQEGCTLTVPAPSGGVVSGKFVVIGSLIGIAAVTAAAGVDFALDTEGVYEYAKTASLAVAVGDKLYYDATNNVLNKTASGNTLVGIAVEASATSDTTVKVKLGATTV